MMMRGERYQSTRQTRLVAVNLCAAASDLIRPALLRTGLLWVRTYVRPSFLWLRYSMSIDRSSLPLPFL